MTDVYTRGIMEATGCDELTAAVVEELMRVSHPTLDGLRRPAFAALAREAHEARALLADEDPDTLAFFERQAAR